MSDDIFVNKDINQENIVKLISLSAYAWKGRGLYNSDYYEKNNFKSADEFADNWDIDFDEDDYDDYDEAWDEAYDYWNE